MSTWKRWTAAAAASGVLLLGGLAAATPQEAEGPVLDVDSLATSMQLDDAGRADLEELGSLMDRRLASRREMMSLRGEMADVMRSLHGRLTAEQAADLHRSMRRAMQRTMQESAAMRGGMGGGMGTGQGRAMHRNGHGHHGHHRGAMGARGAGGMTAPHGIMPGAGAAPGAGGWMQGDCPWVSGEDAADPDSDS